jgi:hypothetical protein
MPGRTIISWLRSGVNGELVSICTIIGMKSLIKLRGAFRATMTDDNIRVELLRSKARAGYKVTVEERLELFDANAKWLDELQAEQLKQAKAKGARITVENRGWTREELYNDERGLPRGFPRPD